MRRPLILCQVATVVTSATLCAAAPQTLSWSTTNPHPADRSPYYAPGFGLGEVFFSKDRCDDGAEGHSSRAGSAGLETWSAGPFFKGNETKQGDPTATSLTHVYSVSWGRIRYASVDGSGKLSEWTLANADPAEGHILESTGTARGPIRGTMAVVEVSGNSYVYSLGGWEYGNSTAVIPDVFYAKIRPDGLVENWKQTKPLPQPLMRSTAAYLGGSLYIFGGFPSNDFANHTDAVVCAPVQSDGSLGEWKSLASMPKAGGAIAGLADDQYIYLVGGLTRHDPPFEGYSDVLAVEALPNCELGPWVPLSPLPEAAAETPYAVLKGRVYVMSTQESAPIPVYMSPFQGRVSNSLGAPQPTIPDAGPEAAAPEASVPDSGNKDAAVADSSHKDTSTTTEGGGKDATAGPDSGTPAGWNNAGDDAGGCSCSLQTETRATGLWMLFLAAFLSRRRARSSSRD